MIKLFKDGAALAVQTDATDERDFTDAFSTALTDYIHGDQYEGAFEVSKWLNAYTEICCKLRGYKSNVQEQRLLTVGTIKPQDNNLVVAVGNNNVRELQTANPNNLELVEQQAA